MHSRTYQYTEEDTKYAEDPEQNRVTFHYNSDLSGEVIINGYSHETPASVPIKEIRVPGQVLLDFVGEYMGGELISMIESMHGRDLLKYMANLNGQGR